jgi:hypothetical protein
MCTSQGRLLVTKDSTVFGMSPTAQLESVKRKLREATNRSLDLGRIFAVLRDGTDAKSTEVLVRLRLGDSNADVILSLTDDWPLHNNEYQQLESSKGFS